MEKKNQPGWQTRKQERIAYCLFFLGQNILWGFAGYVETFLTDIGIAAAAAAAILLVPKLWDAVNDVLFGYLVDRHVFKNGMKFLPWVRIGTAAVGYGYEYAASTFDRIRLAALQQGDADLQMPILAAVSLDTWGVKESTASEEDEPAWGNLEERAINMEVSTAAADLVGGADAVILRHPASVATIKKFISELI